MTVRVVLDANIFISYLLTADDRIGTIGRLFESISSGRYQLVRSDRLIAEMRNSVASKPRLRNRISQESLEELISLVEEVSIPSNPNPEAEPLTILRDQRTTIFWRLHVTRMPASSSPEIWIFWIFETN